MLIANQKIIVKWNPKSKKYYEELGYVFTGSGKEFEVDVSHLAERSKIEVRVICDYCGKESLKRFINYNSEQEKSVIKKDCCKDCQPIKNKEVFLHKYGVENASQMEGYKEKIKETSLKKYKTDHPWKSKEIRDKIKSTNLEKYGYENPMKNKDIVNKMKETNLEKYGVENPFQNEMVREKAKKTWVNNYGVDHPLKSDIVKEKMKTTSINNYGVDHHLKSEIVREKIKETNLKRYGVDNPYQSEEIKLKIRQTSLEKYGVENYASSQDCKEKIKKTCLKKYGVDHPWKSKEIKEKIKKTNINKYGYEVVFYNEDVQNKIKQTMLERYGVENPTQNEEIKNKVWKKARETMFKNGTAPTSNQQVYLHQLLKGELNYPIDLVSLDIAFLEEKIYIEYDGGGHGFAYKCGFITKEEFNNGELKRNYFLKNLGWKRIRIISDNDLLPSDNMIIKLISNAIDYLKTGHSWYHINIDESIIECSQFKRKIDLGELRKIK